MRAIIGSAGLQNTRSSNTYRTGVIIIYYAFSPAVRPLPPHALRADAVSWDTRGVGMRVGRAGGEGGWKGGGQKGEEGGVSWIFVGIVFVRLGIGWENKSAQCNRKEKKKGGKEKERKRKKDKKWSLGVEHGARM